MMAKHTYILGLGPAGAVAKNIQHAAYDTIDGARGAEGSDKHGVEAVRPTDPWFGPAIERAHVHFEISTLATRIDRHGRS
jgi:hypothetical protein